MTLSSGQTVSPFSFVDQAGKEMKFPGDFGSKVAIFFLRHLGCPLCKEKIAELKLNQPRFAQKGVRLVAVVQSTPKRAQEVHLSQGLPFILAPDREKRLYGLFDVKKGGLKEFTAPSAAKASLRAMFKGHMHGKFEGDEFQVPASFLLAPDGAVIYAHYGRDISDFGNIDELLAYA